MKKIIKLLLIILITTSLTGCFKRDNLENIKITTTTYPIWYVTDKLYGEFSTVKSIYPKGINTSSYELTDKQIKDFSSNELFIFNGLENEKNYVEKFFKYNNDLLIINSTKAMGIIYDTEEVWLDPLNLLNIANNIRKGLNEFISNKFLKDKINNNYKQIEKDLSSLAAKMQLIIEGATNNNILIGSKVLGYLKKYNNDLNIYNLDIPNNDPRYEKLKSDVIKQIESKNVKYIYLLQNDLKNELVLELEEKYKMEIIYLYSLDNITIEQEENHLDYISLMTSNLEELKKELYK